MYNLMIVEDEEIIRKSLAGEPFWTELGFTVVGMSGNGTEAIQMMADAKPDVILVDIVMPHMDGIELIRNIRNTDKSVRCVILSAYDEFKYAQRAIELDVSAFLVKPVKDHELKHVFAKIYGEIFREKQEIRDGGNIRELMSEMAEALHSGDAAKVKATNKRFFKCFDHIESRDIPKLQMICFHMMNYICMDNKQRNAAMEPYQIDMECHDRVMACETLSELQQTVEQEMLIIFAHINNRKKMQQDQFVERANAYIQSHFNQKITLEEVASVVYLHPNYFSELYKVKTGQNFSDYVTQVRIEKAKHMLSNSLLRVIDISEQVGFTDYRYFCKLFKKYTGFTPLEYRSNSLFS